MVRVDFWVEERGVFETVELAMTGAELRIGSEIALNLGHTQLEAHDEFTLQISVAQSGSCYLVRVGSLPARDALASEIKRSVRIAGENALVWEADKQIGDFEEKRYNDIPS